MCAVLQCCIKGKLIHFGGSCAGLSFLFFFPVGSQRFWHVRVARRKHISAVDLQKAGYISCSAQIKSDRQTHSHSQGIKHTQFGQSTAVHITNALLRIKCASFFNFNQKSFNSIKNNNMQMKKYIKKKKNKESF